MASSAPVSHPVTHPAPYPSVNIQPKVRQLADGTNVHTAKVKDKRKSRLCSATYLFVDPRLGSSTGKEVYYYFPNGNVQDLPAPEQKPKTVLGLKIKSALPVHHYAVIPGGNVTPHANNPAAVGPPVRTPPAHAGRCFWPLCVPSQELHCFAEHEGSYSVVCSLMRLLAPMCMLLVRTINDRLAFSSSFDALPRALRPHVLPFVYSQCLRSVTMRLSSHKLCKIVDRQHFDSNSSAIIASYPPTVQTSNGDSVVIADIYLAKKQQRWEAVIGALSSQLALLLLLDHSYNDSSFRIAPACQSFPPIAKDSLSLFSCDQLAISLKN